MKSSSRILNFSVFGLLILFLLGVSAAQSGSGPGQARRMRGPMYNAGTETTVSGTVEDVRQVPRAGRNGMPNCPGCSGVHIVLKTESGGLAVHVGPSAYLESKDFKLAKGDLLTIVGSKVPFQGAEVLIAKEITKGSQVLKLRDSEGFPLWAGFRRGAAPPAVAGE